MGPVTKVINNKYPTRYMSYLVEEMGTPLYSVKEHMEYQGCYFHAQDKAATLAFPAVTMQLETEPEILFHSTKGTMYNILSFNYQCARLSKEHGQFQAKIVQKQLYDNTLISPKQQETLGESVSFQLRSPDATLPEKATPGSIGYDVQSTKTIIVQPNSIVRVPTGLTCAIPDGMYIKLHNRSSNAL